MPTRCRSIATCAIITARPTPEEEARVPHRLYGHVDAAENYSVGRWLARCRAGARRGARGGARADPGRRHRALFQGADAGALERAAGACGDQGDGARAAGCRRAGGAACRARAARSGERRAQARRSHAHRARAGSAGGDRAAALPMARRGPAAAARCREGREGVSRAGAAGAAPPHRCALRRDARRRRARRSARARGAQARSAAAGHEGAWRAVADPASQRRDFAGGGGRRAERTTRAATPSGSSPGCGINCRTGPGWRRKALSPKSCAPFRPEAAATKGTTRA